MLKWAALKKKKLVLIWIIRWSQEWSLEEYTVTMFLLKVQLGEIYIGVINMFYSDKKDK